MPRSLDMETLAALIGSIYEAAFEPNRWTVALPRLTAALHADRAFLGFTSTVRGRSLTTMSHDWDDGVLRRWQDEYGGYDPWYDRSGNLRTGTVVQGVDVVPWDDLRATDVHADVFHPNGIDDLICASVANHGDSFDFVTVHGSRIFDPDDVRTMRLLAPHFVRAAQLHDKLSFLSDAHAAHEALLDRLPYGVVLLDPRGRLLRQNREAERIFASNDGLECKLGEIRAADATARKRLAAAIAQACEAGVQGGAQGGALLTVPRRHRLRAYQVLLAPVAAHPRERIFEPFARRVAAVLVVSDPELAREPAAEALGRLFALTPALSRLAAALAAGRTVAEYAAEASVTEGTARSQLKELFARTGTHRQADLVRLLLGGVAQLRSGADGDDATPDAPPRRDR